MSASIQETHPRMQPLLMATDALRVLSGTSRERHTEDSGYCTNSTTRQSCKTAFTLPSHQPKG